jgi:uncharacterized protein (TIGR02147 family)
MDIFDFTDYRDFLKHYVESTDKTWGIKSSLAEAAGCQRSFFSQVLAGQASLSLEHASGIATFLKFDDDQTEQLLDLVTLEKAQNNNLKNILKQRLQKRIHERENLSRKFGAPSISSSEHQLLYYSTWYAPVIHILTGIDRFQTIDSIAKKLSLPSSVIESSLKQLEVMGLVKAEGTQWKNIKSSIHLSKDSPMAVSHHFNWRQQANQDLQLRALDSIHYTSLQSISKKDIPKFKKIVLEMLEESRSLVIQSGKEEVVSFACDLFVVGD